MFWSFWRAALLLLEIFIQGTARAVCGQQNHSSHGQWESDECGVIVVASLSSVSCVPSQPGSLSKVWCLCRALASALHSPEPTAGTVPSCSRHGSLAWQGAGLCCQSSWVTLLSGYHTAVISSEIPVNYRLSIQLFLAN